MQPLEAISSAQISYILSRVRQLPVLSKTDDPRHRFTTMCSTSQITLAGSLPDQFRDRCPFAAGMSVQRCPQVFVEIELGSLHDV